MEQLDTPQAPVQPSSWEGAFSAYGQAIRAIKANVNPALFYIGVVAIFSIAINLLVNRSLASKPAHEGQLILAGAVLDLVFLPYGIRYSLALAQGKKVSISQLLDSPIKLYINLSITFVLVLGLICVGGLALIVPLIWVIPWTWLIWYVAVDLGCGPIAAFREARRLSTNNKAKIWGIIGVIVVPIIAGSFLNSVPILGSLLNPLFYIIYSAATAFLYIWMKKSLA